MPADFTHEQINKLRSGSGKENAAEIGSEMRKLMSEDVGVFRTQEGLSDAVEKLKVLRKRFKDVQYPCQSTAVQYGVI